jgi:hypothetical protein
LLDLQPRWVVVTRTWNRYSSPASIDEHEKVGLIGAQPKPPEAFPSCHGFSVSRSLPYCWPVGAPVTSRLRRLHHNCGVHVVVLVADRSHSRRIDAWPSRWVVTSDSAARMSTRGRTRMARTGFDNTLSELRKRSVRPRARSRNRQIRSRCARDRQGAVGSRESGGASPRRAGGMSTVLWDTPEYRRRSTKISAGAVRNRFRSRDYLSRRDPTANAGRVRGISQDSSPLPSLALTTWRGRTSVDYRSLLS